MNVLFRQAAWHQRSAGFWIVLPLFFSLPPAVAGEDRTLTLTESEALALEKDPLIGAALARADAADADAIADAQLPDPKLRTGLYNQPLDDLDIGREPSTQLRLGIQQSFPRGDTLLYRSRKTRAQATVERVKARLEREKIRRDLRTTYLDVWYQIASAGIVASSRKLFANLAEITRVQYGSGGSSQQDVLGAELELSRLEDRITQVKSAEELARARLSRWLGADAWRPLQETLPQLPEAPEEESIRQNLQSHPEIQLQSAIIDSHRQSVAIAEQQYEPGWTLGAEYRKRFGDNPDGSDRADMAAVMLTVDIPLFSEKRQDQRLAASQKRADAAHLNRDDTHRRLHERLAADLAKRQRLRERLKRYEERLVREAEENAEAALQAYQSGTTEFTGLMRARITELDIRMQALKLRVDLAKTKASLLYLASGEAP